MNHRTPARNDATLRSAPALATLALAAASCFVDTGGAGASDSEIAGSSGAGASTTTSATTGGETTDTGGETTDTGEGSEALETSSTSATTGQTSAAETGGEELCDEKAPLLAMSSAAVQGVDLTARAVGDELCALEFGAGWRWLDFHYQSQWKVIGRWLDELGEGERGWVIILDNNGNCFDSTHGMTWYRAPGSCTTTCGSPIGLEGPEFMPHGPEAICNPYGGDTPCELARPLVCVFAGP